MLPKLEPIPDEEELESMLRRFQAVPSKRFYDHISSAPWMFKTQSTKPLSRNTSISMRKLVFGLAILLMLFFVGLYALLPSIRVAANQVIHFFLPATSNRLEVKITPSSIASTLDFTNPANFPLSITEAHDLARFELKELGSLPANLTFIGARYERSYNAVIILYAGTGYKLIFTQRPVGEGQDVFSIGENAMVEHVEVGNNPAEYVVGGWKAVSTQPVMDSTQSPGSIKIEAKWDNSLPQTTLRWQSYGMVYEVRSSGIQIPSQSELIEWANGLK